jgi:two-component system, OmpR family, response regulator
MLDTWHIAYRIISCCNATNNVPLTCSDPEFRLHLAFESLECRMAFGGLEAITIGTDWAPHVIVMDISMPGCNGYEATFALRQDRRTSETIILAFTALNDDAEVRKHLADHSFDGYCQKGQPPSKLVTLLMSFAQ